MKTEQSIFFANSVDFDEMAHYEPSHLDLHCLLFCGRFADFKIKLSAFENGKLDCN